VGRRTPSSVHQSCDPDGRGASKSRRSRRVRKWRSLKMTTWSRHSRRIEPIIKDCSEHRPIQQRKVRRVTRGRAETRIDVRRATQKTSRWWVGRDESLGSMKQKYEGKDLHGFGRPRSFAKGTDASWRGEIWRNGRSALRAPIPSILTNYGKPALMRPFPSSSRRMTNVRDRLADHHYVRI
jgi:hypothetical protein